MPVEPCMMRLFWQLAENTSELAHVIFVPCNSQGLQLLIKDLCEMPFFKLTLGTSQSVVRGSYKSKETNTLFCGNIRKRDMRT